MRGPGRGKEKPLEKGKVGFLCKARLKLRVFPGTALCACPQIRPGSAVFFVSGGFWPTLGALYGHVARKQAFGCFLPFLQVLFKPRVVISPSMAVTQPSCIRFQKNAASYSHGGGSSKVQSKNLRIDAF